MSERVTVLGGGSWGATLAALLADKGADVSLWEFDPAVANYLQTERTLKTLPDLRLPKSVHVTSVMAEAFQERPWILSVIPSAFVRQTWRAAKASGRLPKSFQVISATKGLEDASLKRMSEVIAEEAGIPLENVAALSGPSHAEEVCRRLPTAVVAAAKNRALAQAVQNLFSAEAFRVYVQSDVIGVELGGTLKNVLAIGCGIADGLGFGDNTRAALLTRGLNEVARLGVKAGGKMDTFFGLAGMGDLIVTCLSAHSRNRRFGEKIGRGKKPKEALAEMTMVAEGWMAAPAAVHLAERFHTACPLLQEIHAVLYKEKDPKRSLQELMTREPQEEWHE